MLRLLLINLCIFTVLACAFLIGVGTAETKHTIYYKVRPLIYYALGREQKSDRNALYYREKISLFEHDPRQDYDVVFIGDSLTDGADWQSFFHHYEIANRGINGDTSKGILKRIDNIIKTGATQAFVMVGVNDLRRNTDINEVIASYQKILERLLANNIETVVQSTLLTRTDLTNDSIDVLNQHLKSLAETTSNLHYIDLNTALTSQGALDIQYTYDGIHLNGKGYSIWHRAIAPLLTPIEQ